MFIFDNVIMKGGNEMKKRTLVLAALLTLGFAMTAKADIVDGKYVEPQWIVNPATYTGNSQWWNVEADAEIRQWAKNNCADIKGIADEDQRYRACVKKVTDFLTYDTMYVNPHVYYTLRDGKGVCADFTALTKALCDEVGINARISLGVLANDTHDMLKVTINGVEYYSDPTNIKSGSASMYQMTPGYVEECVRDSSYVGGSLTGAGYGSEVDHVLSAVKNNTVAVFSFKDRQYHYVPADEYYAAEKVSEEALIELCRKYGA